MEIELAKLDVDAPNIAAHCVDPEAECTYVGDIEIVDVGKVILEPNVGCIRGKVWDENKKPLQDATISVGSFTIQTDQGGNYCLPVPTGEQDLNIDYFDDNKSRRHSKSLKMNVVGGGMCTEAGGRCLKADIGGNVVIWKEATLPEKPSKPSEPSKQSKP